MQLIGQFQKSVRLHSKQVVDILVASRVQHRGVWRPIEAIDPKLLSAAVNQVEEVLVHKSVLSPTEAERAQKVWITSLMHTSDKDKLTHCTVEVVDGKDVVYAKLHVTEDPGEQQVARGTRR
ncbi:predicted protein [Plenodomus lingam JN3]|uniref:Predicted protein n=1 Tax=Leptosphaeria maculans (strain JN3 / isolate v23.1.3 / race Av1-4-5-6-7-8) TaxID=985895 RepID=E4ZSC9_LEPMJ|nr:predicted protein [Plenodomus lingam JN3]CBX94309.1 predicted protein [Plenodomus lingam JN3]